MRSIMRSSGETVTIMRLLTDENEEMIIANDVVCLISPVKGEYEHWQAVLEEANREVRKGDILKREDGSELQVLRSMTQKALSMGEITQLDLKDYDRREQPFLENEIDILKIDLLPRLQLHPIISQRVLPIFGKGAYGSAVFEAFKHVEIAVRKSGNYAENDRGTDLMRRAFHVDSGNLTDKDQHPAEKQARSDLFAGAIGSYKNPGSHRDVEITAEEAIEVIIFSSHLLRIVDSCNLS